MIRLNEFDVTDAQSLGKLVERDNGRISAAALQTAEILLAKSGARFDFLLGQALLPTQAGEVPADQFAHIHTQKIAVYIL
mgnify:FL=1